jgi:ubiquinone/menaquinone biosynthesis C-methylase UbiE
MYQGSLWGGRAHVGISALREGRAEAQPFGDETFDVVVSVTVLCFVPHEATAAREMARVPRLGGRLVLGELGRFSVWAAERRIRRWFGARTWKHARFRSRGDLEVLAEGAGLRVVDVRGSVPIGRFAPRAPES